jgi:hypothetical protein
VPGLAYLAYLANPSTTLYFCVNTHESALADDAPRRQPVGKALRKTLMGHSMDYLYSLYDALVSIHVPNDKARAVVDAMERDMGTTIATKADLQMLRQELTSQISSLATRAEVLAVKAELHQESALIRKDMELLSSTMTVRLGSMLMLGLGLLFAALKLT